MAGLAAARPKQDVGARHKAGHDDQQTGKAGRLLIRGDEARRPADRPPYPSLSPGFGGL
jgi:hypothetical protein